MSTELAEPPVTQQTDFGMPPRGQSDIFRAVEKKEADKRVPLSPPSEASVTQPSPPAVQKNGTPEVPLTPTKPVAPSADPLDLLKDKQDAKPVSQPTDADLDAKMAEWDKELPATPEIKTQASRESWDKMRTSYKTSKKEAELARREAQAAKDEIEQLKKAPLAPVAQEEIESIKKENLSLKQKNAIWALETDPKFQNEILAPLDQASMALGSLMDTYKITQTDLDSAFSQKDRSARNKAFNEIITDKEMNSFDVEDFKKAIQTVTDLSYKRDEGYQKAAQLNEANQLIAKQEQDKAKQMTQQQIDSEEGKVWDKISKNAPIIKDVLADTSVSKAVREKVKEFLSTEQSPEMKVFAGYASYLLPHMKSLVETKDAEIASLKQALKSHVDGDAPAGAGHAPSEKKVTTVDTKPGAAVGAAVAEWKSKFGQ